jgi:ribonuclease P protein subunit RPR2
MRQKRKRIATQQIERAMSSAESGHVKDPKLSTNLARLAWSLSTKFNVRLGHYRLLFCRACKEFIMPPSGSRYRLSVKNRRVLTITCLKCGSVYRHPF